MAQFDKQINQLLTTADVTLNGPKDWDIKVKDERFYQRVLANGRLGLGESYMEEWWDVKALDQLIFKLLSTGLVHKLKFKTYFWKVLQSKIFNLQNIRRSFLLGKFHYDTGNELFECMLDKRLTYTCGYWKNATTLDQAQEDKLDLVCRKIGLKAGQRILDIGCGWGSFIKYAAEHYGVETVGITVSKQQADFAKKDCLGLPVEVRLQDYRQMNEKFDHVVSLGMFEHVGAKNHKAYMEVVQRCLNDDGLFLLHTIGANYTQHNADPWFHKYIFPNGVLPSIKDISMAFDNQFIMEDYHSFGTDYDKTLMAWFENFDGGWKNIPREYDNTFYRMWKYYLLCSAGAFRARNIQLWQFVFSKQGVLGGYEAIR